MLLNDRFVSCEQMEIYFGKGFSIRFLLTSAHLAGSDCGISALASSVSVLRAIRMASSWRLHRDHLDHGRRNLANPCPTVCRCPRMVWKAPAVCPCLASNRTPSDRWRDGITRQASCVRWRSSCVSPRVFLRHVFLVQRPANKTTTRINEMFPS